MAPLLSPAISLSSVSCKHDLSCLAVLRVTAASGMLAMPYVFYSIDLMQHLVVAIFVQGFLYWQGSASLSSTASTTFKTENTILHVVSFRLFILVDLHACLSFLHSCFIIKSSTLQFCNHIEALTFHDHRISGVEQIFPIGSIATLDIIDRGTKLPQLRLFGLARPVTSHDPACSTCHLSAGSKTRSFFRVISLSAIMPRPKKVCSHAPTTLLNNLLNSN
jgi:hypothetical protein